MKRDTRRTSPHQSLLGSTRCPGVRALGRWALRRWALGLALLGACVGLSGCDGGLGNDAGAQTALPKKSTYIDRKVGSEYEGISLHPDGTYDRTVVDSWGRSYQQQGKWRGYGGTAQTGRSRVSSRLELDGYSDARDVINTGNAQAAPKSTKTLSSGDFYTR